MLLSRKIYKNNPKTQRKISGNFNKEELDKKTNIILLLLIKIEKSTTKTTTAITKIRLVYLLFICTYIC
jgi:hypothetical protein